MEREEGDKWHEELNSKFLLRPRGQKCVRLVTYWYGIGRHNQHFEADSSVVGSSMGAKLTGKIARASKTKDFLWSGVTLNSSTGVLV